MVRMISAASLSVSACNPRSRCSHVLLNGGAGFANLLLGAGARLQNGFGTSLLRQLAAGFLRLEDRQARLPQALLVLLGPGFRGRYVGARLQDRPLGALATLFQHPLQRLCSTTL